MNPYLILGVPANADDQAIRRAYLEGIRQATPEKDPQRFKELTAAYDRIKDEESRYQYELFDMESPGGSPMEVFLKYARLCATPAPLPFEAFKEYLRSCLKK
jgi:curved DNA-binding protein CbpA